MLFRIVKRNKGFICNQILGIQSLRNFYLKISKCWSWGCGQNSGKQYPRDLSDDYLIASYMIIDCKQNLSLFRIHSLNTYTDYFTKIQLLNNVVFL